MKKNKLKIYLKYGILMLGISIFLTNCQKDDDQFQTKIQSDSNIKISTLRKTEIEKDKRLIGKIRKLKTDIKTKNNGSTNNRDVYNSEYDFTINTDYAKHIDNGINQTYTFPIYREQGNGLLENLLLVEQNDDTFKAYIVQYEFTEAEITAINFKQKVNIENKVTFIEINDNGFSDDIFGKYYYNGNCYEDNYVYQSASNCSAGGNHSFSDGAYSESNPNGCHAWGTIDMATSGGYINIPTLVSCDGGGGGSTNTGNTNPPSGNTNNNPHGGGGTSGSSTTPITCRTCPELENPIDMQNDDDDCDTSKEDLKKVFPNMSDSDAETLASVINDKGQDFGIDSDEDLWHFLSQAGHETGGFNTLSVTESTYWTTASKLANTYSKFTMDSTLAVTNSDKYYAPDYLQNSSGVANVAMCCKYGNGNVSSGDGYKYRGRGLFQLTWKDNYTAFKNWYNNKYNPDIDPVTTPSIIASNDTLAILSGLWYYKTRVVDKITIDSTTSVSKVTKPINPAKKGLTDRKQRFQKAKDSINCL